MQERHDRLPPRVQDRGERGRRDHTRLHGCGPRPGFGVARRGPAQEKRAEHEPWVAFEQDERAVGQPVERCLMVTLRAQSRGDALLVELCVDRVGSGLAPFGMDGVQVAPDRGEAVVILAAAQGAGAMTGCEGCRLVEEEELGEAARLQERRAMPLLELEPACDPALPVVTAPDPSGRVVEAATVSVDEASRGVRDELAERCDPILQGHLARTLSGLLLRRTTVSAFAAGVDDSAMPKFLLLACTLGTIAAAAALPGAAGAATTATFTLTAGTLSISAPTGSVSLGTQSVSNGSSTITGSLGAVTVSDQRGGVTTWTASVIATAFTPPSGPADPASNVSYSAGVISQSGVVATAVPASNLTGVSTVATGASAGISSATWDPTISVVVPANFAPGVYSATITHSVA
jgi:hypothetical protein